MSFSSIMLHSSLLYKSFIKDVVSKAQLPHCWVTQLRVPDFKLWICYVSASPCCSAQQIILVNDLACSCHQMPFHVKQHANVPCGCRCCSFLRRKGAWQWPNLYVKKHCAKTILTKGLHIYNSPACDISAVYPIMQFFEKEGCKMVDMTCEEHDRQAASTQFITHTVGRVLGAMELQATPIDTRQATSSLPFTTTATTAASLRLTTTAVNNYTFLWSSLFSSSW